MGCTAQPTGYSLLRTSGCHELNGVASRQTTLLMPKTYRLGIFRRYYKAGLGKVAVRLSVGARDSSEEASGALDAMLASASPLGRLRRIQERAQQHQGARGLKDELAWIEERIAATNGSIGPAEDFALLALERGLDLLDSNLYWGELLQLRRQHDGQMRGLKASAKVRAKLPDKERLQHELDGLLSIYPKGEAIKKLAERHRCTARAVRLKLE